MTWPTLQIAASSAADVWNALCNEARLAKRGAEAIRASALAGALVPGDLRQFVPTIRAARVRLNANDGDPNVQAYARLVSGNAGFVLATESAALKAAYASVVQEGRALFNGAQATMAVDDAAAVYESAACAQLVTALEALIAAVD